MTQLRSDPLAFLGDELDDLRDKHLYRPLRVMSSAQGPIVVGRRPRADQPLLERLPRADPPSAAARGGAQRRPGVRRRARGAVRTIAGTMDLHEELERDLAEFKGTEAVLTFQSGFTANTGVIPTITGEQDLIVSRRPQPRLDHRRDAPLEGAPEDLPARRRRGVCATILREAREQGRDGSGAALSADPRRDRRRVQHGRRHRPAAGDRRGGRGGRRGGLRRRRPRVRASSAGTAAARSTTSGSTAGSRSRSGRCRRPSACSAATSRARRTCATSSIQRARPFLFSTSHPPAVAAACREAIRVMQDEPELIERLWANTRRFKAELARLGFDTGASETPITPVMMGDPDTAGRFSQRLFEEGVFAQPVVFPTVAMDKARIRTIVTAAHADDAARPGARGVRRGRPRARPDRRVSEPGASRTRRPRPRDLPLDGHLHTNLSPDSDVPIDAYAAQARRARDRRDLRSPTTSTSSPARRPTTSSPFDERERTVREAAERWAPQGVAIRFGVEITYDSRARGGDPRPPPAATPTTS